MRRLKAPPEPPADLTVGLDAIREDRREIELWTIEFDGDALEPGRELTVRLAEADPAHRRVRFAPDG